MSTPDRVRSYADAFYQAAFERWLNVLEGVAGQLGQDRGLLDRLQAADTEFTARQPLLDRLLPSDTDAPVRNLLYTLMQHGDLAALGDVAGALRQRIVSAQAAPVVVEVVSAVALTAAEREALVGKLEAQFGSGLDCHYRVDPAILGGLIVRVGDKLIDGSLATRMAAMKQTLGVTTKE